MVTVWASSLYFHEYITINYLSNNTLKSFPWQKQFSITIITSFSIFQKHPQKKGKNNYTKKVSVFTVYRQQKLLKPNDNINRNSFILLSAVYICRWAAVEKKKHHKQQIQHLAKL